MDKVIGSVTKKEDIRVKRTKEWLFQALIELSKEMDFEKITISRLTKKAGIARQTFYRNYTDIKDILEEHHKQMISESLILLEQDNFTLIKLIENSVNQWEKNKEFFLLMERANLLSCIIETGREKSKILIRKLKKSVSEEDIEFLSSFLTGGFLAILRDWILGRLELSKEQMIDEIYRVVQPVFDS